MSIRIVSDLNLRIVLIGPRSSVFDVPDRLIFSLKYDNLMVSHQHLCSDIEPCSLTDQWFCFSFRVIFSENWRNVKSFLDTTFLLGWLSHWCSTWFWILSNQYSLTIPDTFFNARGMNPWMRNILKLPWVSIWSVFFTLKPSKPLP